MSFSHNTATSHEAVEFKGRMLTLSVLRLNTADINEIGTLLASKVQRAAEFFRNMPVLLDVAASGVSLPAVIQILKQHGLVPVAVFQPDAEVASAAVAAGLGVINDPRAAKQAEAAAAEPVETGNQVASASEQPETKSEAVQVTADAAKVATKVVQTPVRSGQQVYARGGDLVVLGAVSPGAEVLADGNIHIYGALRGRALAGVQGDNKARIFCSQLGAELVSIAGCYKISEDISARVSGRAVHVFLEDERLEIAPL